MRQASSARLVVAAMVVAVSVSAGCRRDKAGVERIHMPGGGSFEIPAIAEPAGRLGPDEWSFELAKDVVLDVARESMDEPCRERLAWIEEQTASEAASSGITVEEPVARMTLGGRQVVWAHMVSGPERLAKEPLLRTEMYGVCGDGELVIFQVGYRTDHDPALSRVLKTSATSLRYR